MKYEQINDNQFLVEFQNEKEKSEFIKFFTDMTTVSSGQAEKLGISKQLLNYHVHLGHIRTVPYGKQKRYLLSDIERLIK